MSPRARLLAAGTALLALTTACGGDSTLLPQSGGNAYEVLTLTEQAEARALTDSILKADTPMLPQSESLFDVSHAYGTKLNSATRYARCIVIVSTSKAYTATKIRYQKNVYAQPQLIVNISTPSTRQFKADIKLWAPRLTELITRFEINAEAQLLRRHYNPKAVEAVEKTTGWTLRIPSDMKSMKRAKDFVWLSNNTPTAMQNICVYTLPGTQLDNRRLLRMRDSVMRANIPGERPGMYMATETRRPPQQRIRQERGIPYMETRGLWMMKGDAMGGSFVSHAFADTARGLTVVAEGFVYAPESKKRNLTRRLEAVVCTLAKATKKQ